ncbi:MAG: hypothetical protein F6K19_20355 [Cyanothece sp. SIO1E1]|nr:hypothetical protein [Cyanothece sp. SIO1E1]
MKTPGHTSENASLVVETEGGTVVFTYVWWTETLFPQIDPQGMGLGCAKAHHITKMPDLLLTIQPKLSNI